MRERYGGPEILRLTQIPTPEPGRGQVLVRVAATSINLSDWEGLRGSPAYARVAGLLRPRRPVLGSDIAGWVEACGPGVTGWRLGEEVYADNLALMGGFAEYAVVPAAGLARRPVGLTLEQAAAIPQAGAIAWQGTQAATPGRRVLVNGAGGGSGSFAIQLAKRRGAHVTAVDNGAKLEFMRSLGADVVLDYRRADFTRDPTGYDLILDLVAQRSVFAYRRALRPGGTYACVGGTTRAVLRVLTLGRLVGVGSGRRLRVLAVRSGPEHFAPVAELAAAGELRIAIDRTVGLPDLPAALGRVGAGEALGKVVVGLA